jgi:cytochrome c oxidase subunit 2
MRRETTDLIGSGLLLAALVTATFATLAPTPTSGASVASMPTIASAPAGLERGKALFFVKGCVSCHTKVAAGSSANVGPDLTGLATRAADRKPGMSAADYVRESLKVPSAFIVSGYSSFVGMPDLGLSDDEIAALSAFLLGTY